MVHGDGPTAKDLNLKVRRDKILLKTQERSLQERKTGSKSSPDLRHKILKTNEAKEEGINKMLVPPRDTFSVLRLQRGYRSKTPPPAPAWSQFVPKFNIETWSS